MPANEISIGGTSIIITVGFSEKVFPNFPCFQSTLLVKDMRTKEVLKIFDENGVPCIRVGLCASENLASEDAVYGGANHSAIGELAMGEVFYDKMRELLGKIQGEGEKNIVFYVPKGATSKAVGQKRKNIDRLKDEFFVKEHIKSVKILEKNDLIGYNIEIEIKNIGG